MRNVRNVARAMMGADDTDSVGRETARLSIPLKRLRLETWQTRAGCQTLPCEFLTVAAPFHFISLRSRHQNIPSELIS